MPLANIEKSFIEHLLLPQNSKTDFLSNLMPLRSLSEEKQLSIYRSNVNGAHQKVLGQIYPACLNILGEDYFNQLCRHYRFQYPSIDSDLNNYGKYFSDFIEGQFEIHNELRDFEYLADLAWLEWNWHASYFVKDDEPFDFEKLALIELKDQDKLVFTLSDSFSLHSTSYPLLDIWKANKNNIEAKQEFIMPELEIYFCVSRVNFAPVVEQLNIFQYELLKNISNGLSLTQLSEPDKEQDMESSNDFQNQLMLFIQKNWVTGFSLSYTANRSSQINKDISDV